MNNFSINTSVKGTAQSVETAIGTINVGSAITLTTPHGDKSTTVIEISSRAIKVAYLRLKFDIATLNEWNSGHHATTKIVALA